MSTINSSFIGSKTTQFKDEKQHFKVLLNTMLTLLGTYRDICMGALTCAFCRTSKMQGFLGCCKRKPASSAISHAKL